jgi:predicted NAD/FAD-binding protein
MLAALLIGFLCAAHASVEKRPFDSHTSLSSLFLSALFGRRFLPTPPLKQAPTKTNAERQKSAHDNFFAGACIQITEPVVLDKESGKQPHQGSGLLMRIAVIGSGIAGLSAAWLLASHHEVVVFEANDYAGGHSNTVDVTLDGLTHPVDTGFLVHNDRTYPNLIQFLALLGVETHASEMTFSVSLPQADLEWAGASLSTLFAQIRNLWRPAFWRMVRDILHFNRESTELLKQAQASNITLGQLLDKQHYSQEFREWYLYPMGAAIWSSPLKDMEFFPAETFLQFCLNHGLLQIFNRPQWRTIKNGSREYVKAILEKLPDMRLSCPVQSIKRSTEGVIVSTVKGVETYDIAIMACHTDQALKILADANPQEENVLSNIRYQKNTAWLHNDNNLMPRRRHAWSAWNYYGAAATDTPHSREQQSPVAVTYWLNRLQALPFTQDVFVTLNPPTPPASDKTIRRIEYAHPLIDQKAYQAQKELISIQGMNHVYFCGAWAGYGFHEDGLKAGMKVAQLLGAKISWKAHHE